MKIYSISVFGLSFRVKDETYYKLTNVFSKFAKVTHIKYYFYSNTTIKMDSYNIILDISDFNNDITVILYQIIVFGKYYDLFWYNSLLFCRYYKEKGHTVKNYRRLKEKKFEKKLSHIDTLNEKKSVQYTEAQRAIE